MSTNPSSSPATSGGLKAFLHRIGAAFDFLLTVIRKMPLAVMFVFFAVILYFSQSEQPVENVPEFSDPEMAPKEPPPPADLPPGTNPSVWTCVHRVDSQLSKGLWADIYYGMEARLDGKVITIKVTEKWQELSDGKRQTVAQLVVDTWFENGQTLKLLQSKNELEEIILKRLPDDQTVATWKPSTGVVLLAPQAGA
jgi:hypothetical protein